MVHRIFDSSELRCTCVLEIPDIGVLRLDALRVSRSEVWLDTRLGFEKGTSLEVVLDLAGQDTVVLPSQVLESGVDGLRLRWAFDRPADELDLEDRLMRAAGLLPAVAAAAGEAAPRFESWTVDSSNGEGAEAVGFARGVDGQLDVEATLRGRSRTFHPSQLASIFKQVRVLDMKVITDLIRQAVDQAAADMERSLTEEDRARLLEESERSFAERLQAYEAEKQDLEARRQHLEEQLAQAQALLDEERRQELQAHQFTLSDAGMMELEQKLGRLLDRAARVGGIDAEAHEQMRSLVLHLLDEEREKIRDQAQGAQSDRIDLLERKISRLSRSLDETRTERDLARRRAQALEANVNGPWRNIYEPGLHDDDPLRQEKLELLLELVEENHELRRQMAKNGKKDRPTEERQPAPGPQRRLTE